MSQVITTSGGRYTQTPYESEASLERAIIQLQAELFGPNRFYLDVKRKIGAKGRTQNIPDGYLLDLSGTKPRLYVVENELAAHDPLRHIAVQILQFSLSFESEPLGVKRVLIDALNNDPRARAACEQYATLRSYRGVDHLLEHLVFDSPFSALVIIDEMPDGLEKILSEKFRFGVEVLELRQFENDQHNKAYSYEPFLADLNADVPAALALTHGTTAALDTSELDTVVVPAREDGFEEVFIGENRWYQVRIHGSMRPQIKYIAVYQVAPVSAITHIAPVRSIEPWKDTDKFVLNFSEPAKPIGPISLLKSGRIKALQNLRYTTRTRLLSSKTLDDVWGEDTLAAHAD